MSASYQLYRNTTLGNTLQESIDELIQCGQISPQLALKILLQFDHAINTNLSTKAKNRITFKAHLHTYRFCDNVWTLIMTGTTFKEQTESFSCDSVKFVACDGKVKHSFKKIHLAPLHRPLMNCAIGKSCHSVMFVSQNGRNIVMAQPVTDDEHVL